MFCCGLGSAAHGGCRTDKHEETGYHFRPTPTDLNYASLVGFERLCMAIPCSFDLGSQKRCERWSEIIRNVLPIWTAGVLPDIQN